MLHPAEGGKRGALSRRPRGGTRRSQRQVGAPHVLYWHAPLVVRMVLSHGQEAACGVPRAFSDAVRMVRPNASASVGMAGRGEAGLPRVLPIAAVVATAAVASLDCWRHCFGLEARWRRAINDKLLADAKVYEIKVVESHRRWQNHWPALDQRRSRAVRVPHCDDCHRAAVSWRGGRHARRG